MNHKLRRVFLSIAEIENPQLRGIEFQGLLKQVLIESRFEVHQNPRVSKPRQSDLLASKDDLDFLIEAKWLKKKIDVSDIDDLRVRLQRAPSNVIGCLFSMSAYAPTAIKAVEADRQREILLFRPEEVEDLAYRHSIDELIKRKRKAFRVDGKVWFAGQKGQRTHGSKFPFPSSDRSFRISGSSQPSLFCRATDSDIVFTPHTLDITWGSGGRGVELSLTPELNTAADLSEFLALLHNQLGLSEEGAFTISQTDCQWHGLGIQNFLNELRRWEQRYTSAKLERIHHSEDLHYFDQCHTGLLLLTVRQQVGKRENVRLHGCRLEIRLPGVPIDMRPFAKICENVRETLPFFSPFDDGQREFIQLRGGESLDVLGEIVSAGRGVRDEEAVCGLTVKNPFFNKKSAIPSGKLKYSPFQFLHSTEHFVCDMADWHDVGDAVDYYRLTRLEAIQMGGVVVAHPVCTWDNILERKRAIKEQSFEERLKSTVELAHFYGAKLSPKEKRLLKRKFKKKRENSD